MNSARSLVRGMSLFDATSIVVGSMIGSGIFIVSAETSRIVGSPGLLIIAWVAAGCLTIIGALCCAELGAMLPQAGGQYVYFREAFGPLAGFLFGWTMFLVIQSGTIAAVAVAFAKFVGVFWPQISSTAIAVRLGPLSISTAQILACLVIAFLTFTNATGVKTGTVTQNLFTVTKFLALISLTVLALILGRNLQALTTSANWFSGSAHSSNGSVFAFAAMMAVAMVGPLFSQSAWNNLTFAGEEVRDPARVIPRALLWGCAIVAASYVLANLAYLNVLPFSQLQHPPEDRVASAVATSLLGAWGAKAAALAIIISTFGCLNGLILSGARIYFAMAKDQLFFRGLQKLNRASVPANALWAQAGWAALLTLSGSYSDLLKFVISVDLLFYLMLMFAVIVLRRRRPNADRPFRTPLYPVLPMIYAGAAISLIILLLIERPRTTVPGYLLVLTGLPTFWIWNSRR